MKPKMKVEKGKRIISKADDKNKWHGEVKNPRKLHSTHKKKREKKSVNTVCRRREDSLDLRFKLGLLFPTLYTIHIHTPN